MFNIFKSIGRYTLLMQKVFSRPEKRRIYYTRIMAEMEAWGETLTPAEQRRAEEAQERYLYGSGALDDEYGYEEYGEEDYGDYADYEVEDYGDYEDEDYGDYEDYEEEW